MRGLGLWLSDATAENRRMPPKPGPGLRWFRCGPATAARTMISALMTFQVRGCASPARPGNRRRRLKERGFKKFSKDIQSDSKTPAFLRRPAKHPNIFTAFRQYHPCRRTQLASPETFDDLKAPRMGGTGRQ
jgi:hypothetical protein